MRQLLQVARLDHLPSLFELAVSVSSCFDTALFAVLEQAYCFEHQGASYFGFSLVQTISRAFELPRVSTQPSSLLLSNLV